MSRVSSVAQEIEINYYIVSILNSPIDFLTYKSDKDIKSGTFVDITLRKKELTGVVISKSEKPTFECEEILVAKEEFLPQKRLKIARFISTYYVCSLGEAIGLFVPFAKNSDESKQIDIKTLPTLSALQERAFRFLQAEQTSLLFGDTASGKTEIYIKLIAKVLEEGKTALFLMPEISLTPQMEKRLKKIFLDTVEVWHSKITKKRKQEILENIQKKKVRLVVGARSALFLPMRDLGLIVVDEEHDSSYKSSNKPRYNARDIAIYFGKVLGVRVVLGSATPSLQSYSKFPHFRLKGGYVKSQKEFIFEKSSDDISQNIINQLKNVLQNSKQAIIFLPTRANFKYISCFECGEIIKCPFCSVGMSLHKKNNALKCHYCGYVERLPKVCPNCKSENLGSFRMGTEEVKERLCKIFPSAVIEKFDKDAIKSSKKLKDVLKRFSDKKIDILVGTQMLSKGHDYSDIELSVILGIDNILAQNDFRARENALSLAVQIAGRSGRGGKGVVILQSSNEEFFKRYIEDYETFLKDELSFRDGLYPPFVKMLRVLISHTKKQKANEIMQKVLECIKKHKNKEVEIVGSGESFIEKIGGKYRYDILLRSKSANAMLQTILLCRENFCQIDMDPLSFS